MNNSSLVMTTHHLEEAEELSDQIILMNKGTIIEKGTVDYIKSIYGNGYEITLDRLEANQKDY